MVTNTASSTEVRYCGRTFTGEELGIIYQIIADRKANPTRHAISRAICQALDWRKHNGELKDLSCRVALLRMEKDGLLSLPAPTRPPPGRRKPKFTEASGPQPPIIGTRGQLKDLKLSVVDSTSQSYLWNQLIARYHYLGYQPLVGAQLRYLVYDGTRLLAALGFSASAWRLQPRDGFIGWTDSQREASLHLVVNLARFLILPWVKVKFLASSLLSLAAKHLPEDWWGRYRYHPVLLETFVDERFLGTCFKAANWIWLGQTQGRGKKQYPRRRYDAPIKEIFLYPLCCDFRHCLGVR